MRLRAKPTDGRTDGRTDESYYNIYFYTFSLQKRFGYEYMKLVRIAVYMNGCVCLFKFSDACLYLNPASQSSTTARNLILLPNQKPHEMLNTSYQGLKYVIL